MGSLLKEGSLGSILLKSQIITEQDIETALSEQKKSGKRFGEALISLGIVTEDDIDWALSHQLDIPFVRIGTDSIDPVAIALVPGYIARKFQLIPIIKIGDELRIAIADPLNKLAVSEVERVSGCSVSLSMGLMREITQMHEQFYGSDTETGLLGFSSQIFPPSVIDSINSDATGAKLLDYLLFYVCSKKLSSLSLKPLDSVTVTGRQGSASRTIGTLPFAYYQEFINSLKKKFSITGGDGISSKGTLRYSSEGISQLVRVSIMKAGAWEFVTMKPLVISPCPISITELGTTDTTRDTLLALSAEPEGLVFFGSSDAGERTRLMGLCILECERLEREILLLGKGFDFCSGNTPVVPIDWRNHEMGGWIDAASEHEPAVIAVEEMARASVFAAAFDSVLGGKLLLAGLPAPGVRTMIRQLCHLKERLPILPSYLRGVVACRGVRMLCPACKRKIKPPVRGVPILKDKTPQAFYAAKGCPACDNTGYTGISYIVEAVRFDDEMVELFNGSARGVELMRYIEGKGFHGIVEEALKRLQAGEITLEEYISATIDKREISWQE